MNFSKKSVKFWLLFWVLNVLLFLPKYFLNLESSTFFPDFNEPASFGEKIKFFFRRENMDIFRLSLDFLILVWFLILLKNRVLKPWHKIIMTAFYILLFFYQIYQGLIYSLYQQLPLFYSDYFLIIEGIKLVWAKSFWYIFIFLIILVIVSWLIWFLMQIFINSTRNLVLSFKSKLALSLMTTLSLMSTIDYLTRLADQRLVFPLETYWMIDNAIRSQTVYRTTHRLTPHQFKLNYDYQQYNLDVKPNIYLLFIESYGKVLYDNEKIKTDYLDNITKNQNRLTNADWYMTSAFSVSPVRGGRSWLAYTSFVLGAKIDNHATYDYLINHNEYNLPTLYKSLKNFGYDTYWLNSIYDSRKNIPVDKYDIFYGVDERIEFKDLKYNGKMYGVLSAPADQYSLNFTYEYIKSKKQEPFIVFFITLNSHHPFESPGTVTSNWKKLAINNDVITDIDFDHKEDQIEMDYLHSIQYEFDYLTDFIINNGEENDLFILIGDHQPPIIANKYTGFETPVHVISQNKPLVDSFLKYGFNNGLSVLGSGKTVYHEAFHSIIMREIIKQFGVDNGPLPPAYANGISLNQN